MPGGCAAIFGSFLRAAIFCVGFFQFTDAFFGSILPIFAIFCCVSGVFHQNVKQCYGHKIFVMYN